MKLVQKTIGRWVQRLAGKSCTETPLQPARQVASLDPQSLRQVSGGTGASAQTPTKGW